MMKFKPVCPLCREESYTWTTVEMIFGFRRPDPLDILMCEHCFGEFTRNEFEKVNEIHRKRLEAEAEIHEMAKDHKPDYYRSKRPIKRCAVCGDHHEMNVRLRWCRFEDEMVFDVCCLCAETGKVNSESVDNFGKPTPMTIEDLAAMTNPVPKRRGTARRVK